MQGFYNSQKSNGVIKQDTFLHGLLLHFVFVYHILRRKEQNSSIYQSYCLYDSYMISSSTDNANLLTIKSF